MTDIGTGAVAEVGRDNPRAGRSREEEANTRGWLQGNSSKTLLI